jgi:hypothetical protein
MMKTLVNKPKASVNVLETWEEEFDCFRSSTGAAHYQIKDFVRDLLSLARKQEREKIIKIINKQPTYTQVNWEKINLVKQLKSFIAIDGLLSTLQTDSKEARK